MLPGATDHSDLYSAQLSKRTPCRVRVNFKRIRDKVEQNGEQYFLCFQQVGEKCRASLFANMYLTACLFKSAVLKGLGEQLRLDLKAFVLFFSVLAVISCL